MNYGFLIYNKHFVCLKVSLCFRWLLRTFSVFFRFVVWKCFVCIFGLICIINCYFACVYRILCHFLYIYEHILKICFWIFRKFSQKCAQFPYELFFVIFYDLLICLEFWGSFLADESIFLKLDASRPHRSFCKSSDCSGSHATQAVF